MSRKPVEVYFSRKTVASRPSAPVPQSLQELTELRKKLRAELQEIDDQLAGKGDIAARKMSESEVARNAWRRSAKSAIRAKQRELRRINLWMRIGRLPIGEADWSRNIGALKEELGHVAPNRDKDPEVANTDAPNDLECARRCALGAATQERASIFRWICALTRDGGELESLKLLRHEIEQDESLLRNSGAGVCDAFTFSGQLALAEEVVVKLQPEDAVDSYIRLFEASQNAAYLKQARGQIVKLPQERRTGKWSYVAIHSQNEGDWRRAREDFEGIVGGLNEQQRCHVVRTYLFNLLRGGHEKEARQLARTHLTDPYDAIEFFATLLKGEGDVAAFIRAFTAERFLAFPLFRRKRIVKLLVETREEKMLRTSLRATTLEWNKRFSAFSILAAETRQNSDISEARQALLLKPEGLPLEGAAEFEFIRALIACGQAHEARLMALNLSNKLQKAKVFPHLHAYELGVGFDTQIP